MLGSNTGDDGMHIEASGNMTERNGKTDIGARFACSKTWGHEPDYTTIEQRKSAVMYQNSYAARMETAS